MVAELMTSGCSLGLSDIDADMEARSRERLERPEWTDLPPLTNKPNATVEQALPQLRSRPAVPTPTPVPTGVPDTKGTNGQAPAAEASRKLGIADCRLAALRNNLDLQVALVDPRIAQTFVSEEEAKFDQLIFAKAKFSRKLLPANDSDLVQFKTIGVNDLTDQIVKLQEPPQQKDILEAELGVSIPLRTGGRFTVSTPINELRTDGAGFKTQQFRSALRFSFSQPLLRDAGINVNVAGIRLARYEQRAADVKTRLSAIRVIATVDKAYWALYTSWGELDVRRQQYQAALDNLKLVRRRVQEGLSAPIEMNRAEIGVAERVEQLVVAETSLKLRQRQLKFLLNDPAIGMEAPTTLIPTTAPVLVSFEFSPGELTARALDGRLELLDLELKLAADAIKIDYLHNQTLPLFMLEYEYSSLGRANELGNALADAWEFNSHDWGLGLRMEIPVSNELRENRLRRAVQEREQRLMTRQLREMTVRREILDAIDQIGLNWNRILAARQNVLIAGKNYDAELKQFKEGLRTMTEVLETLTRLGEAQVREIRAISDYQVAQVDLAFATGTTLGYGHVALELPKTIPAP